MKKRIDNATRLGQVPEEARKEHKAFREWDLVSSRRDHPTILQILIDGRDPRAVDIEGQTLPTLVYLAREKRPQYHHNFKAGALNALLRVSSRISNGQVVLTVDCDMYSNNSGSLRDALCFLMDEEKGQRIAFVQFPQGFNNITKNDVYSGSLRVIMEVELPGTDANGGPLYIGTGCFHRRDILCGKKYKKDHQNDWWTENDQRVKESAKLCTSYEPDDVDMQMGLKYGCPVEDVITGLSIQCRGWRSVYYNPERKAFLGLAPTTLLQALVQHKRWSEGDLQIFLSKYCPLVYGHGKIPLKLQISYSVCLLWAPNCFATLYYVVVPSLCIHRGLSLFPQVSSPWVLPFLYVIAAKYAYSLGELLWIGGTFQEWWNDQRMWLYKRTTSYLFGFTENIFKLLGFAKSGFVVTSKVADEDVSLRYEKEVMEFGAPSPMFDILATLSMVNLFSFFGALKMVFMDSQHGVLDHLALQMLLCGLVVVINLPVYGGLFFRKDNGRMPSALTYQAVIIAILAHIGAFLFFMVAKSQAVWRYSGGLNCRKLWLVNDFQWPSGGQNSCGLGKYGGILVVRDGDGGGAEWGRGGFSFEAVGRDVKLLIDGRGSTAVDIEEQTLPTLLRVSSQISNGLVILIVDCDMYSNNSKSLGDALCFLMDEEKGQKIAFVQFPQNFDNITKNDVYSNSLKVVEALGDGNEARALLSFHLVAVGNTDQDDVVWVSSRWLLPFLYVIAAKYGYSLGEFLWSEGTFQEWWNDQRIWLNKKPTSYIFGFTETILKLLVFAKPGFVVTSTVADEDVSLRYEKEVMEFGAPFPNVQYFGNTLTVVVINLPVYGGLFLRKDKGRMPSTVTCQAVIIAIIAHIVAPH
ncbi:hypothetical protein RHSIM_Rhsim13G0140100 [Rhododendron simsii]|uniref:Uncharacterized protein n=1 Tax=Rhododendron simsii TaxID=118357 RepID=A0A834L7W5_RHOSS|nr:hypothetical protein RHSIM_Rhsim13G0140100 [Rhododendron simsii]